MGLSDLDRMHGNDVGPLRKLLEILDRGDIYIKRHDNPGIGLTMVLGFKRRTDCKKFEIIKTVASEPQDDVYTFEGMINEAHDSIQ